MKRDFLIAWIAMIAVSGATSEVKKGTEPADFSNKVAKPNFFRKEKKKMHHKIVRNNKARSSELRSAASCDNGLKNNGKDCSNDEECCSKICTRSKQEEIDGFSKKCVQCETPYDCPAKIICSGAGTTQALCTGDLLPEMPGIDRMTSGYNIFKGTPLIPGRSNDKGWRISKYFIVDVFSPEYDYQGAESFTHDGTTYLVPSKYTVQNLYAQDCTFKSESMETSTSLSHQISKSVNVNGEFPIPYTEGTIGGGVGQASVETWQQDALKSKMTSVSKCTSYHFAIQLKLNSKDPYPPLSDEMIYFLENNFDGSTDSYYDLFDSAGTHIILRATLGSMLGVTSSFSSEAMNEIDSACESSTDSLSAGVAGLFSFGQSSSKERCETAQTAFSNNQESYEQWSVGSTITSSQEAWEQDVSSPDILQMGVKSICDVIDKEGFDKATCKSHYKGYCETRLRLTDCVVPDNINCIYDSECDGDSGGIGRCVDNQCFQVSTLPQVNVALHGWASQSSTYMDWVASKAIDGIAHEYESVTHTDNKADEWWRVDLNNNYAIGKVAIWNRSDCCSERLSGSKVEILNSTGDVVDTKTIGDVNGIYYIEFEFDGIIGKSVKITKNTLSVPLSLAEVQVYAEVLVRTT